MTDRTPPSPPNKGAFAAVPALAAAAVLLLPACRERAPSSSPESSPDVLLISIDSLRPDHLGAYGYPRPTSPTIDRLASEGIRFAQAVSSSSWTLPAHAALFTGLEEQAHGLMSNGLRLSADQQTLAERFRELGYRTLGLFAGPYLHPTFGLDQGFETYLDCTTGLAAASSAEEVRAAAAAIAGPTQVGPTGGRTVEQLRQALAGPDPRPAFVFLHLWDVHYDYAPPPPWDRAFDDGYDGATDFSRHMSNPAIHAGMPAEDRRRLVALYDGEIGWTDSIVAELLALHAERRPGRERLIVLLSDHGDELFEHGGKGHQRTLFDEVVRIPLIFHWPGRLDPGRVLAEQVGILDVLPTTLALVGAAVPPESVHGRSLVPLLMGEPLAERPALLWLRADPARPLVALRSASRKLIYAHAPELPALYDLVRDPGEMDPRRAASELERAGASELRRRVAEAARYLELHPERRPVGAEPEGALAEELLALGYLTPQRP